LYGALKNQKNKYQIKIDRLEKILEEIKDKTAIIDEYLNSEE